MPTPLATRPFKVLIWLDSSTMFGVMPSSFMRPRMVWRRKDPSLSMTIFVSATSSIEMAFFLASGLLSGTQQTIWFLDMGRSCRRFEAPDRMMMPKSSSSRSSCSRSDIEASSCMKMSRCE